MTKIYDLGDPAKPLFIRDFGPAGQEPGATGPPPSGSGAHGLMVLANRIYFADGMLPIVDRQKLLTGPE